VKSLDRLPFRVIVGWLVLACALGYLVSLGATSPDNLFADTFASGLINYHAMIGWVVLMAAALAIATVSTGDSRSPTVRSLIRLATLLTPTYPLLSLVPQLAQFQGPVLQVTMAAVGVAALAAGLEARRIDGLTPRATGLLLVGLGQLGVCVAMYLRVRPELKFSPLVELTVIAALALLGEPLPGARLSGQHRATLILLAALAYRPLLPGYAQTLLFARLFGFVALAYFTLRGLRERVPSRLARWTGRLAVLAFLEALLIGSYIRLLGEDVYLRRTLFGSSASHMGYFCVLLALLAVWLREREPLPRWPRAAGLGLVGILVGTHVFAVSMMVLGAYGNQLHVIHDRPELAPWHVWATVGASVFLLGLAQVVLTVRRVHVAPPEAKVFD